MKMITFANVLKESEVGLATKLYRHIMGKTIEDVGARSSAAMAKTRWKELSKAARSWSAHDHPAEKFTLTFYLSDHFKIAWAREPGFSSA